MGRGAKTQSAMSRGDLPPDQPRGPARTHFQGRRRPGALPGDLGPANLCQKFGPTPSSLLFSSLLPRILRPGHASADRESAAWRPYGTGGVWTRLIDNARTIVAT